MTGLLLPAPARLSRADVGDIWWFFCASEGELGAKSNYGSMVAVLQNGGPIASDPWGAIDDAGSRALAAARHRRVEDTLREVPRSMIRVLHACHATDPKAWTGWARFGESAGAAQFTERAASECEMVLERMTLEEVADSGGRLTRTAARKRVVRNPQAPTPDDIIGELVALSKKKEKTSAAARAAVDAIAEEAQALLEASERVYLDGKHKVRRRAS